jgi:hypothetical protein
MITDYTTLHKAAKANNAGGRLYDRAHGLIIEACDRIFAVQHYNHHHRHQWIKEDSLLLPRLEHATAIIRFLNVQADVKLI